MSFLIRAAHPDDAAGIVTMFNPIIETGLYTAFDTPFTVAGEREYISSFPARGVFHVAIDTADNTVAGFQTLEPFSTFTHAFDHVAIIATFVDLARHRQGIASRLYAASFAAAVQKGYEKIFTYVRGDNPIALATYQAHGFTIVGRALKQARINGKYIDEIMIEKFLTT